MFGKTAVMEIFKAAFGCPTLKKLVLSCEKHLSKIDLQLFEVYLSDCKSLTTLKFVGEKPNTKLRGIAAQYLERNIELESQYERANVVKSAATMVF